MNKYIIGIHWNIYNNLVKELGENLVPVDLEIKSNEFIRCIKINYKSVDLILCPQALLEKYEKVSEGP